jgi:hypothetical protein
LTEERVPYDHYGEALKAAIAQGAGDRAELVAALKAAITESVEDCLRPQLGRQARYVTFNIPIEPPREPPAC